MAIQYSYALLTMTPCPLWFWYRWASAGFLLTVFVWSVYNGATYYIDVFGKRFERELERLRKDVQRWQGAGEEVATPGFEVERRLGEGGGKGMDGARRMGAAMEEDGARGENNSEQISLLAERVSKARGSGSEFGGYTSDGVRQRN